MHISMEMVSKLRSLLAQHVGKASTAESPAESSPPAPTTKSPSEDTVQLSDELQRALELLKRVQTMEVDEADRVREIAEQVRNGQYRPEARKVAESLLAEWGVGE